MCLCMLVHAYACFSFLFACMCFVRVVRLSHLWSSCSTHSRHACKSCRNCACVGLAITVCIYMPCMAVYLVVSLPKTTVYTLYIYGPGQRSLHTPYMTVYMMNLLPKHRTYTVHLVITLPKILYMHRVYVWFWPTLCMCLRSIKRQVQPFGLHVYAHAQTHTDTCVHLILSMV